VNHEQATPILAAHYLVLFASAHSGQSREAELTYFCEAYLLRVDLRPALVDEGEAVARGADCLQALRTLPLGQGEMLAVAVLHSDTIAHTIRQTIIRTDEPIIHN
jgi:hypothetical protein